MKKSANYFIDSSAWLSYLYGESSRAKRIIESEAVLYASVLTLFEVRRKLEREGHQEKEVGKALTFIKDSCIVVAVDEEIAETSAQLSLETKLHTVDALIYVSALNSNSKLITCDSDFRALDHVELI